MELRYRTLSKRILTPVLLICVALVIGGSLKEFLNPRLRSKLSVAPPKPPLFPNMSIFKCINSPDVMSDKKRVVVLHGPDWILESTVELSCFPEREVVLSAEVGRGFLRHPKNFRARLWITKIREIVYVRIVESSEDEKQDMIAIDIVTNHKCVSRASKGCIITGGASQMIM